MASDNFNRANETPLASPWASDATYGGLSLASNVAKKTASGTISYRTDSTATRSRAKIAALPETGNSAGVVICSNGNGSFYRAVLQTPSTITLESYVGGYSVLDTATVTPAAGDEIELYRDGGDVVAKFQGSEVCRATNSAATTGAPGIILESAVATLDDWSDQPVSGGAATKVVFTTEPANAVVGTTMAAIVVQAQDAGGAVDTSYTANVVLALQTGSGTPAGTLTRAAVAGVVTFNDIVMNTLNTGAVFRATSGALTLDDSATFNITAGGGGSSGGSRITSKLVA